MVLNGYDDWQVGGDEGTAIDGFHHFLWDPNSSLRVRRLSASSEGWSSATESANCCIHQVLDKTGFYPFKGPGTSLDSREINSRTSADTAIYTMLRSYIKMT